MHLERAWERTGRRPPELDGPQCPAPLRYVLEWFMELNAARGSSGFGVSPIGYGEILAWARLTGARPTPFEVDCLRRLDGVFIKCQIASKQRPGDKPRAGGKPKL